MNPNQIQKSEILAGLNFDESQPKSHVSSLVQKM